VAAASCIFQNSYTTRTYVFMYVYACIYGMYNRYAFIHYKIMYKGTYARRCTHVSVHAHTHTYVYIFAQTHMHKRIYVYTHAHAHAHAHTHICLSSLSLSFHPPLSLSIRVCIHTQRHTHLTHSYIDTCPNTHTQTH